MKGLWHSLLPFATDCAGVYSLFADSDSVVIGQDPGGSVLRCREFSEHRPDTTAHFSGVHLSERDVVIGNPEKRLNAFRKVLEDRRPEQIVLTGTPVSSMVAIDLKGLGRTLEKETGIPVLSFPTTGGLWYDRGLSTAFLRIYRHLSRVPSRDAAPGTRESGNPVPEEKREPINLLGLNTMDFPDPAARDALVQLFVEDGYEISSIWGIHSGLSQWSGAFRARRNVVCSVSGLALAKKMEKDRGIPYEMLYDTETIQKELRQFAGSTGAEKLDGERWGSGTEPKLLVIGEQVTSHSLRLLLEHIFPGIRIRCAGFFERAPELERNDDLKWQSENDMIEHLRQNSYDLVVADPVLLLAGERPRALYPFIHPPVSGHYAGQFGGILPDRETVQQLIRVIESRKE